MRLTASLSFGILVIEDFVAVILLAALSVASVETVAPPPQVLAC